MKGVVALLSIFLACGCANLESIGRRTILPANAGSSSKAIHLDAKQRLVFAKDSALCAEPSPDAMSSLAASLGAGASAPGQGSASLATALTTSAASIGLRTQSITLMRDALYRVCEAYYSDKLSNAQVMLLLARSQDLTATVVAVEQLTGAVVAQQAILGGSASAQAISALVANTDALERIQDLTKKNQEELAKAILKRDQAQKEYEEALASRDRTRAELDNVPEAEAERKARLQSALSAQVATLQQKEAILQSRRDAVALAEKQVEHTQRVEQQIAQQLDSAITTAAAMSSGNGQLSPPVSRDNLSDAAVQHVSLAVERVVTAALSKRYLTDTCIAIVTRTEDLPKDESERNNLLRTCFDLITNAASAETVEINRLRELSQLRPATAPPAP